MDVKHRRIYDNFLSSVVPDEILAKVLTVPESVDGIRCPQVERLVTLCNAFKRQYFAFS